MAAALIVPEKKLKAPASYPELRTQIQRTITSGQRRAENLLQTASARTFWEVGRWIDLYLKHEKQSGSRAPYGEKVVVKLAEDLDYSKTLFYDALRFARKTPIFRAPGKLTATHQLILLKVTDKKQKHVLASRAAKGGWSTRQLEKQMKAKAFHLVPRKGKLSHYKITERKGTLYLDLGFRDWQRLPSEVQTSGFRPGDIVEGTSFQNLKKQPQASEADLFTYRAEISKVPDADTYWLFIDKGFESFRHDKIRLRGIDTAEISTRDGRRAKQKVEKLFGFSDKPGAASVEVLITTTKVPDKWDRYLVDLYFEKDGQEIYINRWLLEQGLALPYRAF